MLDLSTKRAELASKAISAPKHWRIMTIGREVNGSTDIVACLQRALRNVGHQVLHIDVAKHPGLLDNPHKHRGGFGPIYVRADKIEGAISRFQPHFIVLLAGGQAFREEDATRLKERGIVLVGITLSDPDVLESVVDFAESFDFHTTNARVALGEYEKRGIKNTLYFPFGVDRAFVTQQLRPNPAFAADVICLGHATARPERDEVMTAVHARLGQSHVVRTYGRGWTLPHSQVVEGLEVLQASRAGRVHINFPMTRAGFVNVKCGVFETVASGGLLVTSRFEEMARFFDYDEEIGGYADYDELPEYLEGLFADPERVDAMRVRAFDRLISEHLYEHRWISLFADMERAANDPAFPLDDARRRAVQEVFATDAGQARPITISGFYGARNIGDDLILEAIATGVEAGVPGGQVTVVAQNPSVVEAQAGYNAVSRKAGWLVDDVLGVSDALIVGGGGLWHDYTFRDSGGLRSLISGSPISIAGFGAIGLLAKLRKIPFHVMGLGVGPLGDPEARDLVKFVAELTDSLTVRDPHSVELLRESGVAAQRIELAPDVVYSLSLGDGVVPSALEDLDQDHRVVGVNLRPWTRGGIEIEVVADRIAKAVRQFAETSDRPVTVALVPMQMGATHDEAALDLLRLKLEPDVPVVKIEGGLTRDTFIGAVRALDVLISMRLHACLVAHRCGVPAIGLAYDPKLTAHFEEIGRSEFCLGLDVKTDDLSARLKSSLNGLPKAAKAKIASLEAAATAALADLAKAIEQAPQRPRIWGIPSKPAAHEETRTAVASVAPLPAASAEPTRASILKRLATFQPDNAEAEAAGASLAVESLRRVDGCDDKVKGSIETGADPVESHTFHFAEDAPAKGDWVGLEYEFKRAPKGRGTLVEFTLHSPYKREKNMGRFLTQILWNGVVIGEEDVAVNNSLFRYRVQAPGDRKNVLGIRLIACATQKAWKWHEALLITVANVSAREADKPKKVTLEGANPHLRNLTLAK